MAGSGLEAFPLRQGKASLCQGNVTLPQVDDFLRQGIVTLSQGDAFLRQGIVTLSQENVLLSQGNIPLWLKMLPLAQGNVPLPRRTGEKAAKWTLEAQNGHSGGEYLNAGVAVTVSVRFFWRE